MRITQRLLPTLALTSALALALAAPAAASGHSFSSDASGAGLELTVADQTVTIGSSEVHLERPAREDGCDDDIVACAEAAGAVGLSESATASAPGDPGPNSGTAFSSADALPGSEQALLLEVGVAVAEAVLAPDPTATAEGGAARAELTVTQTLAEQSPVDETLTEISDQLAGPIAEGEPSGTAERVKSTVDLLAENLAEAPLLAVDAGPSHSETTDPGTGPTATATAEGATVVLSPTADSTAEDPEGLVIIEVGAARATATTDQFEATADFDPAIVRVRVLDPTTGEYDELAVEPGESQCILEDTPLSTCIIAADGETTVEGAAASAAAHGVAIEAFGDPLPPVALELAAAEAGVNAVPPPEPDEPDEPAAEPPPNLPRTGGGVALPALGVLGLGAWLGRRVRG